MRDIEFRGKVIRCEGRAAYPGYKPPIWAVGSFHKNPNGNCVITDYEDNDTYSVIPETVGEYTGLKDKNGVKIFEGDIIAWKQYADDDEITRYSIVKYGGASFFFSSKSGYGNPDYPISYFRTELFDVVGNIHDNPELPNVK